MKCPKCKERLYIITTQCFETVRVREYICLTCEERYLSNEKLDSKPYKKGIPKRFRRKKENEKSLRCEQK